MIAVPKPRTIQSAEARVRHEDLVPDVLDDREAGADGKAVDRGVDQEADPVRADQGDDDQRLAEFLDHRAA